MKRVLFVAQEIYPYLPETTMSKIGRHLPQGIQEKRREIRTFMPRYGCINERRNQLHEVIRLSGMNLIIDDNDHPLIIKVASIPTARMQVYFIDNEDYFLSKSIVKDDKGYLPDNDERAIFFARGVLETVKKLRWSPDLIHCQGWFTGLVPIYLKKCFSEDPLFADTKIIYSVYNDDFEGNLDKRFHEKILLDGIDPAETSLVETPDFENLSKLAIEHADGIIIGDETINSNLQEHLKNIDKPVLEFKSPEEYIDAYSEFYDSVMPPEPV